MIGPNCIGTMNLVNRVYCGFGVGFKNPHLKNGPVAFVSQSGGFAYSVVALADAEGMGFNYIVSAGNEVDITTLELAADFLERDEVEVLVLYLEGVADGRRLRALGARALELGKPILTWKAGNSAIGRAAAESHTASMTAAQIAYWEKVLTQVVAQPEWKSDLERNYLTDDFAVGERFRAELKQDYASMKAVLVELGLAK